MKNKSGIVSFFATMLFLMLAACGGGGSNTNSNTTIVNSASPTTGTVQISGTVQPDSADPTANGAQVGATVYVIGQEGSSVQTDSNGNFSLNVDPQLSDIVLSGPSLKGRPARTASSRLPAGTKTINYGIIVAFPHLDPSHGRKVNFLAVTDQHNTVPTIYVNTVGSITGHAYLQNQTDHSGITVYIPGTSFSAITAADGSYTISHVPSGTYDVLRAEKFGTTYRFAMLSNITVNSAQQTVVADMLLQLSTGPFGSVLINNGAAFTNSAAVNLSIAPSGDAVLMSISDRPDFVGATWEPVQSTKQYTFPGSFSSGGSLANVYIKFAQDSGLASSPITTSIYIDTAPMATRVSPVSVTMSQTPTLQWDYAPPMPNPTYHVQLTNAGDTSFLSPLVDEGGLTDAQDVVPSTLSEGAYIWCVAITYSGTELNWGPAWAFTIDRTAGTLQAPLNLSKTNTPSPHFSWLANPSASSYGFILATNSALTSVVRSATGITGNSYDLATPLSSTPSTTYYWAVTPYDSLNNPGTISDVWSFRLDTAGPTGSVMVFSTTTGTGIVINDGDVFTGTRSITPRFGATDSTGIVAYYLSESATTPSASDPGWTSVTQTTNYSAYGSFILSGGTGSKTVYVWFKDAVGNISSTYSDTINLLDFTPNTQTIDQGGNGGFPSMTYAPNAGVNVVYVDELNNSGIKYLTNYIGSWSWPLALDTSTPISTGSDHSLVTHATGTYSYSSWSLHMAYSDGYSGHTYYLYKPGLIRSPWQTRVTVDTAPNTYSYNMPAIAVSSNLSPVTRYNKAHIAYTGYDALKYATNETGSWATTTVDNSTRVYGQSLSIAVDSNNDVYISYLDYTTTTVKVVKRTSGVWGTPTSVENVGTTYLSTSLAVGLNDNVHLAYTNGAGALRYASLSGSWTPVTAAASAGMSISLAVDPATDAVYVSYPVFGALRLATNVYGAWAYAAIDTTMSPSQTSLAVSPSSPHSVHIAYFTGTDWSLRYTFADY